MKIPRDKARAARPGGGHCAIGAIAVLLLSLGGTAPVAAQEILPFRLERISGVVETGFLTNLEDRSRSSSSGSDFDRVELSQLLHLNTHGYIYHPRFLTFDTGFRLEPIEGLAGQSDTRLLWGGDFRFNFLQEHPNSLSVYGTRIESETSRAFSETYDLTSELYGVTFLQKWGWIPFDLSYQHSARKGGVGADLDDSADKVIFDGRYEISERSDGKLSYDVAWEEIRGRDLRRQNLAASNLSFLGEGDDKKLRTIFRFFEEIDGQERRTANGSTKFDWKHTDNLRTHYAFSGRWSDFGVQDSTNLNANFSLKHRLYDSLKTNFSIFGGLEDATFRRRAEIGGRIAENYLKRLGDWGRLDISVSPHASMAYDRPEEDTALVFDERHVMLGIQPVLLRQPDIIESSIVVTDENGSIVYEEGRDWEILPTGSDFETWLRRTPGTSTIADGELVLVDYEYELLGDNDTLTTGVGVHTSLAFLDHWRVFGRYDNLDFHVFSGDEDDLRLNSYDRYRAGLEFSCRWCSARAQYEDNDASITPSWGYSGAASVFTYGTRSWSARLRAEYVYRDQGNSDLTVDRYTVSGSASKRFFDLGVLEFEGRWLRGRWSGESSEANDIDAIDLKLKYSWWYEKVEVKLETGFVQLLRPTEDRSVFKFDLRLRRVF